MPRIPPPTDHPDSQLHLEEALEHGFSALAALAEAAGWSPDEAAHALFDLAVARLLALEANRDTGDQIAEAIRRIHGH